MRAAVASEVPGRAARAKLSIAARDAATAMAASWASAGSTEANEFEQLLRGLPLQVAGFLTVVRADGYGVGEGVAYIAGEDGG